MSFEVLSRDGHEGIPDGFEEMTELVYADEPMYVPHPPGALHTRFSADNPWFETGRCRVFCIPEKARLAAFFTPSAEYEGKPAAFFGYWETMGDEAADDTIFARAFDWMREQGAEVVCGPINFNTYGIYRLRTVCEPGGYTFSGEPFNPTYYPAILRRLGFEEGQRAVTQLAPAGFALMVAKARQHLLDKVRERGFTIESLPHETWLANLEELHGLVDQMFSSNFAYTSLTYPQFEEMCGESWIRKVCPKTSIIAHDPDGRIAGFFLTYPHYGPLIVKGAGDQRINVGELNYDDHFPLLKERGHSVDAVSKTVAVVPGLRNKGIMTAMAVDIFEKGGEIWDRYYGALISEHNWNRHYADKLALDARWYAVYQKGLT